MSLTAREQYWLNKYKPFGNKGFNIAREAGSKLGIKRTPEQREKMKTRPQSQKGRKFSPATTRDYRLAHTGRTRSREAIEKTRQGNLGKKHTPELLRR